MIVGRPRPRPARRLTTLITAQEERATPSRRFTPAPIP
jgi:hypothetical protein